MEMDFKNNEKAGWQKLNKFISERQNDRPAVSALDTRPRPAEQ